MQNDKTRLHRATYTGIRENFPSLPSPPVQTATDQASDMLKRDKFKHKIRKKPLSPIRYDKRTLSVFLESGYCTISTCSDDSVTTSSPTILPRPA
jgi:hypothetical protein